MQAIAKNSIFTVEFNGSATYFITDNNGDCWATKDTERKAMNYYKKASFSCNAKELN